MKKRLLPVASFGGAAASLLKKMTGGHTAAATAKRLSELGDPWTKVSADRVVEALEATTTPEVFLIHGHSPDWEELFEWITDEDLAVPRVLKAELGAGRTIPEKFEQKASETHAAIALVTPDDVGQA